MVTPKDIDLMEYATDGDIQTAWGGTEVNTDLILLCNFEGQNEQVTEFRDDGETGHIATKVGDAGLVSDNYKFGNASMYIDGVNDYITFPNHADWNFGSGDFTVDLWYKPDGLQNGYLITSGLNSPRGWNIKVHQTSGAMKMSVNLDVDDTFEIDVTTVTGVLTTLEWHHIAFVRYGNVWTLYVNGVDVGNATLSGSTYESGEALQIGTAEYDVTHYPVKGWIDEVRVSKGIARWTTGFTPPTSPYTSDTYTKLLLHMDGRFDESPSNHKPVFGAGCEISTTQAKFGDSSLSFDGTSTGYIEFPDSDDWAFGTDDFTIDFFVRFDTMSHHHGLFSVGTAYNILLAHSNQTGSNGIGVHLYVGSDPGPMNLSQGSTTCVADTWYHIAIVRSGSNWYLFLDGTQIATDTDSTSIPNWSTAFRLGHDTWNVRYLEGYLDSFRITRGVALWTSTFTPPSAPPSPYLAVISSSTDRRFGDYSAELIGGDGSEFAKEVSLDLTGYKEITGRIKCNQSGSVLNLVFQDAVGTSGVDENVSFLFHFDGDDEATSATDVMGNQTASFSGGAELDTAQKKFGTASLFGNNGYVSITNDSDYDLSDGSDFTIDFWVRIPTAYMNTPQSLVVWYATEANRFGPISMVFRGSYGHLFSCYMYHTASWPPDIMNTDGVRTISADTWYHLAVVRNGTSYKYYIDGTLEASSTTSLNPITTTQPFHIGKVFDVFQNFRGHIDEFRFSKGIARWTSNFTPPTSQYVKYFSVPVDVNTADVWQDIKIPISHIVDVDKEAITNCVLQITEDEVDAKIDHLQAIGHKMTFDDMKDASLWVSDGGSELVSSDDALGLKLVASTSSLADAVVRTFTNKLDMSGMVQLEGRVRASRAGSNFKVRLYNDTTWYEQVIDIKKPDTWQKIIMPLEAGMDNVTVSEIEITNADEENTIYLDNFEATIRRRDWIEV